MREIVDILLSHDLPVDDMLGGILSGQADLIVPLWVAIISSLVRHSILFVCFNLSIAYVGVLLEEREAAQSFPSGFEVVGLPWKNLPTTCAIF